MSSQEYGEDVREVLIEEVRSYGGSWTEGLESGDITEDEDFLYLEVLENEDISSEFHELGTELSGHTSEVNQGEKYILAVEKQLYFSSAF